MLLPKLLAHVKESCDPISCQYPNLYKTRFPLTGFAIAPGSFENPKFNVECNRSDYYQMPLIEDEILYGSNIRKESIHYLHIPPTAAELDRQAIEWAFKNGDDNEDDQFIPNKTYAPRKQTGVQSVILKLMYGMPNFDERGAVRSTIRFLERLQIIFLQNTTGRPIEVSRKIDTYRGRCIVKLSKDQLTNPIHRESTAEMLANKDVARITYVDEETWTRIEPHIVKDDNCNLLILKFPQHSLLTDGAVNVILGVLKGDTRVWADPNATDKFGVKLTRAEKQIIYNLSYRELYYLIESTIENYFSWRLKRTEFKPSAGLPMLRPGEW